MNRKQFTFYSSFFTAVSRFEDPITRASLYDCICQYALTGKAIKAELSPAAQAAMDVIFPVLESGRNKALQGKKGGEVSPNASKDKIKEKDKTKDKTKNKTKNKEKNKTKHKSDISQLGDTPFEIFWNFYPRKVGKIIACEKFEEVDVPLQVLLKAIQEQKESAQWQQDGGIFIPNPATWLQERRWEDQLPKKEDPIPKGASGLLGEAELAAIEKIMRD